MSATADPSPSIIRAAVLVPLFAAAEGLTAVLTLRTDTLPTHKGQVAFPGGRFDARRDDSLLATALREAHEEIGLDPAHAEVVGALPDVSTVSSPFVISSFVARVPSSYPYAPCAREVAAVFTMPLQVYGDPAFRIPYSWRHERGAIQVPAIRYQEFIVWGATLRILDLLMHSPLLEGLRTEH
jgi:8-oxo-dGTP pyrophosphatase MutT (NUDIX family)